MKKVVGVFILLAAILIGTGLWIVGSHMRSPQRSTKTMRVVLVLPCEGNDYWETIREGLLGEAAVHGLDVRVYYPQTNYDFSQIADLVRRATAAQVDAIVVQGSDNPEFAEALQEAADNEVLLALVDTDIPALGDHLYVGTDNYQAGRLMGERLAAITGGQARVAVIMGASEFSNLMDRLEGLKDAVFSHPDIRIERVDYSQFDTLKIIEAYYSILRDPSGIDTIVCLDGMGGVAFGSLLGPSQKAVSHILGFDIGPETIAALKNGMLTGTVIQNNYDMGRIAAAELFRRYAGGAFSSPSIYTEVSFVTAADLEDNADAP